MTHEVPSVERVWSPQQATFLDWCRTGTGSCVLEAVAGSGKTTTILEAAKHMRGGVVIVAFGAKIAKELKDRLERDGVDWRQARAGTFHSLCLAALKKAYPDAEKDEDKLSSLADQVLPKDVDQAYRVAVLRLVGMAKQRGIGVICGMRDLSAWDDLVTHYDIDVPDGQEGEAIDDAIDLLKASVRDTARFDYSDMIYQVLVHRLPFPYRYGAVFVDEAQDTNPVRREALKRLLRPGGRLVAVGDPRQAIFGFTGADNDALDVIVREFGAVRMPLSVTFRCPSLVVRYAHRWVDHIQAADNAPEGLVGRMDFNGLVALRDRLDGGRSALSQTAVLCRNTKPMVKLAFRLIRAKVPCRIEGADVGKGLLKLLNRWKATSLNAWERKFEKWSREEFLAIRKRSPALAQNHVDRCDTVRAVVEQCRADGKHLVDDAKEAVKRLFEDDVSGMLTLSTIHKAKGREWRHDVWLDRVSTCPSRMATTEWMLRQEDNLCYVAATRSLHALYEMSGDGVVEPSLFDEVDGAHDPVEAACDGLLRIDEEIERFGLFRRSERRDEAPPTAPFADVDTGHDVAPWPDPAKEFECPECARKVAVARMIAVDVRDETTRRRLGNRPFGEYRACCPRCDHVAAHPMEWAGW